ncbi:MAG TPA: peptidoglycan bridge formation glycyltransferase FemA/FemB family protein, partial [Candidatus Dormibacteraeota bacterium]|nr:peptidoglycan bridge formation glycyltransferase FemA/FemB family protein [Candidatus Dormibacteraeota bacterium]
YFRLLDEHLASCQTYVARVAGKPCAAAVVARFGGRAYYLYAGSTGEHRDANPAYAALWAGIKAAAQAGCRDFDLWGVAPSDQPNHPWAGLSVFKRGFGADEVEYVGCWEIIFDPSGARVLSTLEATRRLARRLR